MRKIILLVTCVLFIIFSTNIVFDSYDIELLDYNPNTESRRNVSMSVTKEMVNKNKTSSSSNSSSSSSSSSSSLVVTSKDLTLPNVSYKIKDAPSEPDVVNKNAKSYMRFQALGYQSWNVQGYLARQKGCSVGKYDIRMLDGRYLIALGSYYTSKIGQYVDVILSDGTVVPCILGDQKADPDTDPTHRYHASDKSVMEFIISSPWDGVSYTSKGKKDGYKTFRDRNPSINGSFSNTKEFKAPVKQIVVYDKVYKIDMNDLSGDIPDAK